MSDKTYQMVLEQLQNIYPGRVFIGVDEVAAIFDCSKRRVYDGTSRRSRKSFPVQPANVPGKKFRLVDCAKAIAKA